MNRLQLIILLLVGQFSVFAQTYDNPTLSPYELGGQGQVVLPDSLPEFWAVESREMELTDLPKTYPYRTAVYFENGKLITLHVIFGETGEGLPVKGYETIKNILLKLWSAYPTGPANGRRGIGNLVQVWETKDFRMEWTYKNQPGAATKKMGWLFIYNRHHYVEDY